MTNDARRTREIECRTAMSKSSFQQEEEDSFYQQIGLMGETKEVLHFKHSSYDAETWTLWAVDKYLEHFEMWCWRRMEKIGWTDRVRNEVLQRVKEQRDIFIVTPCMLSSYSINTPTNALI